MAISLKLLGPVSFGKDTWLSGTRVYLPFQKGKAYAVYTFESNAAELSKSIPVRVRPQRAGLVTLEVPDGIWIYDGNAYQMSDHDLTAEDVRALVVSSASKRQRQLEKARAVESMNQQVDSRARRQPIPHDVKTEVWQRDSGRCVECGSQVNLEFDHIIPLSMGGANTLRNLQLLCQTCNRRKGGTLG